MVPRWHLLWGVLFSLLIWIVFPTIDLLYLFLVFFGSFFIDFDHYAVLGLKKGIWGFKRNVRYHKKLEKIELEEKNKGIFRRGYFHLFHTVEFHVLVFVLGSVWVGFYYILLGMLFHSICDFVWLVKKNRVYRREYWLVSKLFKN